MSCGDVMPGWLVTRPWRTAYTHAAGVSEFKCDETSSSPRIRVRSMPMPSFVLAKISFEVVLRDRHPMKANNIPAKPQRTPAMPTPTPIHKYIGHPSAPSVVTLIASEATGAGGGEEPPAAEFDDELIVGLRGGNGLGGGASTATTCTRGGSSRSIATFSALDSEAASCEETVCTIASTIESLLAMIFASTRTLAAVTLRTISLASTPGRTDAMLAMYACRSNDWTVPVSIIDIVTCFLYTIPSGMGGSHGEGGSGGGTIGSGGRDGGVGGGPVGGGGCWGQNGTDALAVRS